MTAGCGGRLEGTSDGYEEPALAAFAFPADGTPNENGYVGPFCCTGQTATVEDANGAAVGYSYFYGFDGGLNVTDEQSVASSMYILVAGLSNLADVGSAMVIDQVDFDVSELKVGATKSATAGALRFDVVIDHVDFVLLDSGRYFEMGTIAASVTARPASGP